MLVRFTEDKDVADTYYVDVVFSSGAAPALGVVVKTSNGYEMTGHHCNLIHTSNTLDDMKDFMSSFVNVRNDYNTLDNWLDFSSRYPQLNKG